MGYMKRIDIEAQNIFEGKIYLSLDLLEKSIDGLFQQLERERNPYNQELLLESITRCYNVYSLMQIDFWC